MKTLNTLPLWYFKKLFINVFKTAGFRYNLLLVILLFFTQMSLKGQFIVENHTGRDWQIALSVAPYSACTPFYPDVITQTIPAYSIISITLPLPYSACTSCRVVSIKDQGGSGVYDEAGDVNCSYSPKAPLGECIAGPNPSTLYYLGNWHSIIGK